MKKTIALLLAVLLLLGLTACSSPDKTEENGETSPLQPEEPVSGQNTEEPEPETNGTDTLVVVFSATGNTKKVAEKIAAITGADLYEILAQQPYSEADLNWNDRNSRSTKEQNDKSMRPAIGSKTIDLSGYKTIFIGFPIWWGEEPRIMDTFVESYSFEGITMIPFCTSSSSGIGRSGPNMKALSGSGNWLEGKRFGANASEADIQAWIDKLN